MTVVPVPFGTAEQLARLAHFRALDLPEVGELDCVARFLIGNVGGNTARQELWQAIRDDAEHLFRLISDDWTESDLDELRDEDWWCAEASPGGHQMWRWMASRDRLASYIENRILLARYVASAAERASRAAA